MAGNKHGGKNYKRNKKGSHHQKEFNKKTDDQEYARVVKKLGDRRFLIIQHNTKEKIMARARKSLKQGHLIDEGSIVLIACRDFQEDVVDIIEKYSNDDIRKLKKEKEITDPSFLDLGFEDESIFEIEEGTIEIEPQRNYDLPSSDDDIDIDDL